MTDQPSSAEPPAPDPKLVTLDSVPTPLKVGRPTPISKGH